MSDLTGSTRNSFVRATFTRIARKYDLLNRLMTLGQDRTWRRETVNRLAPPSGHLTLDLGAGTGELAAEVLHQQPDGRVIAVDLTPEMIRVGNTRHATLNIDWVIADSDNLPFTSQLFSGVVSGFLLRNVSPLEKTLREQKRVLALDGSWAALDTTRPKKNLLHPFLAFYLNVIIPLLGRWVARQPEAYSYLPESTLSFLSAEELVHKVEEAGISEVAFTRRMLGTIAIHWGVRTSTKA